MELVERTESLTILNDRYKALKSGMGNIVFLVGEAGAGKTSLVNHFIKTVERSSVTYTGGCDPLFTPRPLAPLYDIAGQMGTDFLASLKNEKDRSLIFTSFLQKLSATSLPTILVFEDVHWADESTVDLIKFISRRITRVRCLFLLTYREDEINFQHPLKTIFGELIPGTFTKISANMLSRNAVNKMALAKRSLQGEKIYALTGGNPFYVAEILDSNTVGIPERVKDSILSVFYAKDPIMQELWEYLSILPARIEFSMLEKIEPEFPKGIERLIQAGVLVSKQDHVSFKHELYRITIQESLSAYRQKILHSKVLKRMLEASADYSLSQLVHYAKFADDRELVAKMAPLAAREAASLAAHLEAARLYAIALEYTDKQDAGRVELYEQYAYECYLTNQPQAAILAQQCALEIWRERKVNLKTGNALRFLSRLLWFTGRTNDATSLALECVDVLENGFPTHERALAYSNLAQLHMLAGDRQKTLDWGQKAIDLATQMDDQEVLCHALNNVGTVLLMNNEPEGEIKLNQSLFIALKKNLPEHVARAYTNLSSRFVVSKNYKKAADAFDAGLKYCEDHDLYSWRDYMRSEKIKLLLEIGEWSEGEEMAMFLYDNSLHLSLTRIGVIVMLSRLKLRRGEFDEARALIREGKKLAAPTHEAHRIIPVLVSELELCWINGDPIPMEDLAHAENTLFPEKSNLWYYTELSYWKHKCGLPINEKPGVDFAGPFQFENQGNWQVAIEKWNELGCVYEYAIALFYGNGDQQRQSLQIVHKVGATATYEMLKSKLKLRGVRNIPRGLRESTRNNPAQLTDRQIEVLTLLQEGLQNNEIANRLFVSP